MTFIDVSMQVQYQSFVIKDHVTLNLFKISIIILTNQVIFLTVHFSMDIVEGFTTQRSSTGTTNKAVSVV